jgi:hypothetical protein
MIGSTTIEHDIEFIYRGDLPSDLKPQVEYISQTVPDAPPIPVMPDVVHEPTNVNIDVCDPTIPIGAVPTPFPSIDDDLVASEEPDDVLEDVCYEKMVVNLPFVSPRLTGKYHIIFALFKHEYIGELVHGKKHGRGKFIYGESHFQDGLFENGAFVQGVSVKNGVTSTGSFEKGKLHDQHGSISLNGFTYTGRVHHGVPLIDEGSCSFDKTQNSQFMGHTGKITKSRMTTSNCDTYIEGTLTVVFPDCFIHKIRMNVCLYDGNHETTADYVMVHYIKLSNGHAFNYNTGSFHVTQDMCALVLNDTNHEMKHMLNHRTQFSINRHTI